MHQSINWPSTLCQSFFCSISLHFISILQHQPSISSFVSLPPFVFEMQDWLTVCCKKDTGARLLFNFLPHSVRVGSVGRRSAHVSCLNPADRRAQAFNALMLLPSTLSFLLFWRQRMELTVCYCNEEPFGKPLLKAL